MPRLTRVKDNQENFDELASMNILKNIALLVTVAAVLTSTASAEKHSSSSEQFIGAIRSAVWSKPGLIAEVEAKKNHIEVEVVTAALEKFKLKVDPETFQVLETQAQGPVKPHKLEAYSSATVIEAIKLASARYPGALEEVEVERKNGRLYVEVEIHNEDGKQDYYVDMRRRTITPEK